MALRIVLDTDVMVAAIRSSTGASRALLVGGLTRRWTLVLTVSMVVEYEAVMTRPAHLRASGLDAIDVTALIDAVVAVAEPVDPWFRWRPTLVDPDDDLILEAAVNGNADLLVTFNRRHFAAVAKSFGIDVLLPSQAMRRLGASR